METHESPDPYRYESPDRYGTEALTHMGHARNHNALAYHKMFTAQVLTVLTARSTTSPRARNAARRQKHVATEPPHCIGRRFVHKERDR